MGLTLAYLLHTLGVILAAALIYFATPTLAKVTDTELGFYYIVLYALLVIFAVRTAKKIEDGEHQEANDLEKIISKDDKQ